jgi:N-acetylmuramoyl-L-alanine amidase
MAQSRPRRKKLWHYRDRSRAIQPFSTLKLTNRTQCVSMGRRAEAVAGGRMPSHDDQAATRRVVLTAAVAVGYLLPTWLMQRAEAASSKPHTRPKPRPLPLRAQRLVMLDPGHGGKDPGAIGVSGTYEKHVSLAAAFELKRQLEASGLYQVIMTRETDQFIPLDDRVARAQQHRAALFVSMHADALTDHEVRGASVYTLATTASDAQTAQLARRENSADRYATGYDAQPPEVAAILQSLTRTETRMGSARMAHDVVGAFRNTIPILENPARHAEFAVLKAADIPSVLVEMGFMSNPTDEAALRRSDHRTAVAAAMKKAVDTYFAAAGTLTRMEG